jgi:hypothetical protein
MEVSSVIRALNCGPEWGIDPLGVEIIEVDRVQKSVILDVVCT